MGIYQNFAQMADEYSSIPRYMTGDASGGGALRTSSGMSMLMSNAGKSIKQVIYNIDTKVTQPMLERLYFHNMRYADDADLKGDIRVVARGASSLVVKEQTQQRRNEFLQIVASNEMFMDIVGEEAIASLLREIAKTLDMDASEIVPPPEEIRARLAAKRNMAMLQAQASLKQGGQPGQPGQPQQQPGQGPMPIGGGAQLQDGAPVTNTFQPTRR
jgi:hypothetical protein